MHRIGNEIDHIGYTEAEMDYSKGQAMAAMREAAWAIAAGIMFVLMIMVLFLLASALAVVAHT